MSCTSAYYQDINNLHRDPKCPDTKDESWISMTCHQACKNILCLYFVYCVLTMEFSYELSFLTLLTKLPPFWQNHLYRNNPAFIWVCHFIRPGHISCTASSLSNSFIGMMFITILYFKKITYLCLYMYSKGHYVSENVLQRIFC